MNSLHAAICVPLGVLAYWLVGLGPALMLIRGAERRLAATLLAGPLGMAITALIGTCLVRMDMPVEFWAWPWLIAMTLLSVGYAAFDARREAQKPPEIGDPNRRWAAAFLLVTLIASVLVVAPATIGGIQFTALRYNRWDAQNYLGMARYLDHWPLSWIQSATDAQCLEADAMFLHVRNLLATRYTTSLLLAWIANLSHGPLARFEYTHGLIYPVLAIGPVMLLASRAKLGLWHAGLLGLAVATGFWGVYVVDARASSQANSIALLPLIAAAAVLLQQRPNAPRKPWRETALLAISLASLVPVYIESVPLTLAGLGAFAMLEAWRRRDWRSLIPMTVAWVAALLMGCVSWPSSLGFIRGQSSIAMQSQVTWHMDFFPWLYTRPWKDLFIGPWGLGLLTPNGASVGAADIALLVVALLLLGIYGWGVFQGLFRRSNEATVVVHAFAVMAIAQWAALSAKGQLWAGAKGLGFGYVFLLTGVVTVLGSQVPCDESGNERSRRPKGLAWFVCSFLVVQALVVPAIRITYAVREREPANYMNTGSRFMRAADYSTAPFERVLAGEPHADLGTAINDVWITSYFMTALGDRRRMIDFVGVRDRDIDDTRRTILGRQPLNEPPRYLLVSRESSLRKYLRDTEVAAETREFTLLRRKGPQWGDSLAVLQTSRAAQEAPDGMPRYRLEKEPLKITLANLGNHPQPVMVWAEVELDSPRTSPLGLAISVDQQEAVARIGPHNQWRTSGRLVFPPGIQSISLELRADPNSKDASGDAPPADAWLRVRFERVNPVPTTQP